MSVRPFTTEEVATRGREIYNNRLKSLLEPKQFGKFLVIDIETGEYEIDDDDLVASMRAYRKKPDGSRYGMRIGYDTVGTIGNSKQRADHRFSDRSIQTQRRSYRLQSSTTITKLPILKQLSTQASADT